MKRWLCGMLTVVMLLGMCTGISPKIRAEEMTSSEAFVEILKKIEGFAKYPYWDQSQWTVGYGTRCPDDKLAEYKKNGIPEEEALALLSSMLADFEKAVNNFAAKHNLTLNQGQFDALVDFSYNCGTAWMNDTSGYFNTAIREGKTGTDLLYGLCLWSSAGGDFILIKRRMAEANMYLNGVYEAYNDSTDGTYPDTYKYVFLDGNGASLRYIIHGYDAADAAGITYTFTSVPTGKDAEGNPFTYTFGGWYTADGTAVEVLDGSLADGTVLYAQWLDQGGQPVALPKGNVQAPLEVTVNSNLNVRSGPGTYYPVLETVDAGSKLTITETYTYGGTLWGKCEKGWVSLNYTNYQEALAGTETWPKNGVVNADKVNVRSGAGTSFAVQYQLNTGDAVTIHEKTYAGNLYWGKLSDGNWICLTYVTFDTASENPEDPTTPTTPTQPSEPSEPTEPTQPSTPTEPTEPEVTPGDVNGDEIVNKDDAIYLLRYVVYPEKYPISVSGDMNADGKVNKDDAIYLLRHVVYPDKYPLST